MMRGTYKRCSVILAVAGMCAAAQAQTTRALQQLNPYLNGIGIAQAAARAQKVASIHTREQADQRQAEVRGKILKLIGGLREHARPIQVKQFGTVAEDGFRIEKIAYQSFPEFYVTANVFVPEPGEGPFPAIVITPGHGAGKQSEYNWAANFARAGIVALVVDPLGQGERMQPGGGRLRLTWRRSIAIYGNGSLGIVALHAAALDSRIRSIVVENTLASYRMVLDQPLHRNISEVMIPGVLRKYDVGNLVLAISPRPVTIINPQDATGAVINKEQFRSAAGYVFQSKGPAVRVLARKTGEPLPFELRSTK